MNDWQHAHSCSRGNCPIRQPPTESERLNGVAAGPAPTPAMVPAAGTESLSPPAWLVGMAPHRGTEETQLPGVVATEEVQTQHLVTEYAVSHTPPRQMMHLNWEARDGVKVSVQCGIQDIH